MLVVHVVSNVVSDLTVICLFFFQAEDGIRDLVRSRGLGDVYKRQPAKRSRARGLRGVPGHPARLDRADQLPAL